MLSPLRIIGPVALFLFLLCFMDSFALSQNTEVGISPTLRSMENKSSQTLAPQYVIVELSQKKLFQYYPELKGITLVDSQQDLPTLLQNVAANETFLLDNIPSLNCQEDVVQEQLDKQGTVRGLPLFTGRYRYMILGHVIGEGFQFREGRTDMNLKKVDANIPSRYSLLQNFALLPLHFHSFHQSAARYHYLGRQSLDSHNYYVVAFAQAPEHAQLVGVVNLNGNEIPVIYQGVAWIDPDNFQIARMRVDLLKPRPEVGAQATDVYFSEVQLPVVKKSFWLPREVVVKRPAKGGYIREKHQFSDYRIFVTDAKPPSQAPGNQPK